MANGTNSMRLQVKSRITRLAIRAILSIISAISGSSPVTAAMKEPVRTEAGLVSEAPARDPSITVKGIDRRAVGSTKADMRAGNGRPPAAR